MSTRPEGFWTWIKSCYQLHVIVIISALAAPFILIVIVTTADIISLYHFNNTGL